MDKGAAVGLRDLVGGRGDVWTRDDRGLKWTAGIWGRGDVEV